MTALLILAALILGFVWSTFNGPTIAGALDVYVAAFIVGLASAATFAIRSRDRRAILAALVLVINFAGSHLAWAVGDPEYYIAGTLDLGTALYFILRGQERWELVIGGLFLVSVVVAFLSFLGVIPGADERTGGFVAISYPDIAAAIGHIANAVLGFASGDSGKRVRIVIRKLSPFRLSSS